MPIASTAMSAVPATISMRPKRSFDFRRFPRWIWRNTEVVEFIEWLRAHNDALPRDALPPNAERTGFYGLDRYSLHASMKAVLQYLGRAIGVISPPETERASHYFQ